MNPIERRLLAPSFDAAAVRRDVLLLVALTLALVAPGIGLKDPWPADEPRFALIARDMVETGDWLFPRRAGELYPDKPPVFMWTQAAIYATTGSIRLAHLLPGLLAGLGVVLLVYDLGRRLWHRRVGLWAGLALLFLLPQFVVQARSAQIDGYLCLFTTLGLYGVVRHVLRGPAWGWYWTGFAAMGVGVITKGVGFLPMLALLPWALARRRGWSQLAAIPRGRWRWWLGLAATLLVIGAWLAPMVSAANEIGTAELASYRDNILLKQTAERYAVSTEHAKPFHYFVTGVIPRAWAPLVLLSGFVVPAWWRRLRRRDARYLILLGWVALVVAFFTFSAAKRGVYLLPAAPAIALAVAPLGAGLYRKAGVQRTLFGLTLGVALVLAAAAGLLLVGHPDVAEAVSELGADLRAPIAALAGLTLAITVAARPRRGALAWGSVFVTIVAVYGLWIYPLVDAERSARTFMADLEAVVPADHELAMVDWREQFVLQSSRPLGHFGYWKTPRLDLLPPIFGWLTEDPTRRLLIPDRLFADCVDESRAVPVGHKSRRDWYVIGPEAVRPGCTASPDGLRVFYSSPPRAGH